MPVPTSNQGAESKRWLVPLLANLARLTPTPCGARSTVARIYAELRERFEAFCRRSLYDVNLVVLFLDAIYLPVRACQGRLAGT